MGALIYMDNHATTPLDPVVLKEMMPYLTSNFANAASITHALGRQSSQAIENARQQVAQLLGTKDTSEIIFTSGSTEGINTVLKGIFEQYQSKGKHFITCTTEHKAVLDTFIYLQKKGASITYLTVDHEGKIDLQQLETSIRPDTVLLTFMSANNETGVCHPLQEIAEIAQRHDVLFFCDATQTVGKEKLDLHHIPIDLLSLSAHKMYGPKGVGALFIRKKNKRIQLSPLLHGGGQEDGRRAGTLNVPAIVGLGKAAELCKQAIDEQDSNRLAKLRNRLEESLLSLPEIYVNGHGAPRLKNVCNITIRHIRASTLLTKLQNLCLATGSACVTGNRDPSHVLLAMGLSPEDAFSTVRISLGRFNTMEDVDHTLNQLISAVNTLRAESPSWQLFQKGLIP